MDPNRLGHDFRITRSPDMSHRKWIVGLPLVSAAIGGIAGPLAMAGKTIYDLFKALKLAREEWVENKALCVSGQIATLPSLAPAVHARPEADRAAARLAGHS